MFSIQNNNRDLAHSLLQFHQYKEDTFIYLSNLWTHKTLEGCGIGRQLLQQTNQYITEQNAIGLLTKATPRNMPGFNIYDNNSWKAIDGHPRLYCYNNNDKSDSELVEIIKKIKSCDI